MKFTVIRKGRFFFFWIKFVKMNVNLKKIEAYYRLLDCQERGVITKNRNKYLKALQPTKHDIANIIRSEILKKKQLRIVKKGKKLSRDGSAVTPSMVNGYKNAMEKREEMGQTGQLVTAIPKIINENNINQLLDSNTISIINNSFDKTNSNKFNANGNANATTTPVELYNKKNLQTTPGSANKKYQQELPSTSSSNLNTQTSTLYCRNMLQAEKINYSTPAAVVLSPNEFSTGFDFATSTTKQHEKQQYISDEPMQQQAAISPAKLPATTPLAMSTAGVVLSPNEFSTGSDFATSTPKRHEKQQYISDEPMQQQAAISPAILPATTQMEQQQFIQQTSPNQSLDELLDLALDDSIQMMETQTKYPPPLPNLLQEQQSVSPETTPTTDVNKYLQMNNEEKVDPNSPATKFVCNVCNRSFPGKSQLTNHSRTHRHEKKEATNFFCNICVRFFDHRCHFNSHMRTHRRPDIYYSTYLEYYLRGIVDVNPEHEYEIFLKLMQSCLPSNIMGQVYFIMKIKEYKNFREQCITEISEIHKIRLMCNAIGYIGCTENSYHRPEMLIAKHVKKLATTQCDFARLMNLSERFTKMNDFAQL